MAINLDGAFLTMRDCARQMIEQGEGGAIVAISSTSAIHGAAANPQGSSGMGSGASSGSSGGPGTSGSSSSGSSGSSGTSSGSSGGSSGSKSP